MSDKTLTKPLSVYLAGPITGSNKNSMKNWRDEVKQQLATICTFDDPTERPVHVSDKLTTKERNKIGKTVVKDDFNGVKNSDVFLLNVTAANRVSIGSIIELAWATYLGKVVVIVMDDENVHEHYLLRSSECSTFITDSLSDACAFIERFHKGEEKLQDRAFGEGNDQSVNNLMSFVMSQKPLIVDIRQNTDVCINAVFMMALAYIMQVPSIVYMQEGSVHDHAMLREIADEIRT